MTTTTSSASSPKSNATIIPLQPSLILPSSTSATPSHPARAIFNCQNFQTPYAATISHVLFDISCGTENFGGDFMSLESSTLENCMEACASFNLFSVSDGYDSSIRCSIINYYIDDFMSRGGNCWLKQSGYPQPAKLNQTVTSASLRGGVWGERKLEWAFGFLLRPACFEIYISHFEK